MTTTHTTAALSTSPLQQALSLGLAALVTSAVLAGLLGVAGGDQAAQLAQQMQQTTPPALVWAPLA